MKKNNKILVIAVIVIGFLVWKKIKKSKSEAARIGKVVHKKIADKLTDRQIKRRKARIYNFLGSNPEYKDNINELNNLDTVLLNSYLMLEIETEGKGEEYEKAAYKRENFTENKIYKVEEILIKIQTL